MSKLEKMMEKDGWFLGYWEHYGIKYWSFRKKGFEIEWKDVQEIIEDKDGKNFKAWRIPD